MLRVYQQYLGWLVRLRPVLATIERRDPDLARQLRRAAASVALNMAEGQGNEGGTRRQRYLSALGSARETLSCLEVAETLGYVVAPRGLVAELQRMVGTLVVLAVGRAR